MEVTECPRHPEASIIGSKHLGQTAPIADKSSKPRHKPPHRREVGHPSHWYSKYSEKREGRGEQCRNYAQT